MAMMKRLLAVLAATAAVMRATDAAEPCNLAAIAPIGASSDMTKCLQDTGVEFSIAPPVKPSAPDVAKLCANATCYCVIGNLTKLGDCSLLGMPLQSEFLAPFNTSACAMARTTPAPAPAPIQTVYLPTTAPPPSAAAVQVSDTTAKSASESSKTPAIAGGIVGAVVLAAIVAAFVIRKRKSKDSKLATDTLTIATNGTSSDGSKYSSLWADADLLAVKVSVDDIEDVKKIGSGAFAEVWLVKFRGTQLMASKRMRPDSCSRESAQAFIAEIKLVSTLQHPNVVACTGVAWIREADLQALFEYMDNGDLRTYLTNPNVPVQWSAEKLSFAVDIAQALVYVHSFLPPLVHRDLKSRNVLLNSAMQAKLTDFGVSRYRSEQNTMTTSVGTGRWMAPEVLVGDGTYGTAADMFSFGVLLSELDSHQIPYEDARAPNGSKLPDVALLQLISTGKLTPTMSAACPEVIADTATRCFSLDPDARPSAVEAAYALRTLLKSMIAS